MRTFTVLSLLAATATMSLAASSSPSSALRGAVADELTQASVLDLAAKAGAPKPDPKAGPAKADDKWYIVNTDPGLTPKNVVDLGDGKMQMIVKPYEEAVRVIGKEWYDSGKMSVLVKSAAVTPGIITSVYLASDSGRVSDQELGKQDELDLEWKGNDPTKVQTNVFLYGEEDLELIKVGGNSSAKEFLYGLEWDAKTAKFYIDDKLVRTTKLKRPMLPMKLQIAVWTTIGGWPGLIQWAGSTDWDGRAGAPATATFKITEFPTGIVDEKDVEKARPKQPKAESKTKPKGDTKEDGEVKPKDDDKN